MGPWMRKEWMCVHIIQNLFKTTNRWNIPNINIDVKNFKWKSATNFLQKVICTFLDVLLNKNIERLRHVH